MYGNSNPGAYKANQVSTVSKSKLIILMYDGAIRFIKEARQNISVGNVAKRGSNILKAQRIVDELNGALDRKAGGEVAISLGKVYFEITRQLTDANISGNKSVLDKALKQLTDLREAWEKVINGNNDKANRPSSNKETGRAMIC